MSSIKKLAGETLWYGVPTIIVRFLGYITSILLFRWYGASMTSQITQLYAVIPFLNILYTYGLETSYFKFANEVDKKRLFNLLTTCLLCTTIIFTLILFNFSEPIAKLISMPDHVEFVKWMAWILLFDTLSVMPFVKLREEGKPRKYAFIKVVGISINLGIIFFFVGVCPSLYAKNPNGFIAKIYDPNVEIGYYVLANVVASIVTLLLLFKQFVSFKFLFDKQLFKKVMTYSYPLIIVGLGGNINELLSRLVYTKVVNIPFEEAKTELGIFGANFKVAVLITIFIQVFRMGAEPFFFKQSTEKNAPKTYAKVMKYFVIVCCVMWLAIVMNLQIIKHVAYGKHVDEYSKGLSIIPILAMGSVFLGIYYNLSVWYKLTNKTLYGAYVTIAGAVITIILNIILIPIWHYNGSAWATFLCYLFMMIISYVQGQKHYKIPYAKKKLIAYLVIVALIFFIHKGLLQFSSNSMFELVSGNLLLLFFIWLLLKIEKKEFIEMPYINKIYKFI